MPKPAILPPTHESLTKLSAIGGDDRCVLTVYFAGSKTRPKKGATKLVDLAERLLKPDEFTDDEREHLKKSLELWRASIPQVDLPEAEAWMGVVSWLTEDAAFVQLPAAVTDAAYLDNSPYLLTAALQLDDYEAYAVVYADHMRARVYLAALGALVEEGRLRGDIKNHVRKGGWSQQRYERRRDKEIHHYCKAIVEKLKVLMDEEGLRRVVLAGDRLLLKELEERMPHTMREGVVCRLPMEDKKDAREVFRETLAAAAEEEGREEKRLLAAISTAHASGGRAVVGAPDTLKALGERRVHHLLIGPMKGVEVTRCRSCGHVALEQFDVCPKCGSRDTYEQSAANELLDMAFAGGSRVELSEDALSEIGGVGALLRW